MIFKNRPTVRDCLACAHDVPVKAPLYRPWWMCTCPGLSPSDARLRILASAFEKDLSNPIVMGQAKTTNYCWRCSSRWVRWVPTKDMRDAVDAAFKIGGCDAVAALYRETRG